MSKQKIIFVAGLHGNERMPVEALTENGIRFILGNPRAYEKNTRYTKKDLNASFGVDHKDYECVRAKEILNEISGGALVVDFHTTASDAQPFVIVVDEKMLPLAGRTGIERVVIMRHNIKNGHALINHRSGISVEAGTHKNRSSYQTTLGVVRNVLGEKEYPVVLYEAYDEIKEPGDYKTFQMHADGFIPILSNEPEYESQGLFGLKARRL
ncbi:succinylglutamate desuccinylase/aspartoacylase family protein [Patescibacteria group bacterium]|nr:succinylglutamate desuccinylase/aspartoacylase family protein [Patescibacteria group bacterium]